MGILETTWKAVCKVPATGTNNQQREQAGKKKSRGKDESILNPYVWLLVGEMTGKFAQQKTTPLFL